MMICFGVILLDPIHGPNFHCKTLAFLQAVDSARNLVDSDRAALAGEKHLQQDQLLDVDSNA